MSNRCRHCVSKGSYCKGPIETPRLFDLDWLDATKNALLESSYQSIGLHLQPQHFGIFQVKLMLKPSSEQEFVSDSPTYNLQSPGLRDDSGSLCESSILESVLDAALLADIPLCMAPKSSLYDMSLYEVCSRLRIDNLSHTDPKTLFSVFADVSAPVYRYCAALTKAPWTRRIRMTTERFT